MTEPLKPASQEVVVYTPRPDPADFPAKCVMQARIESAYSRGVEGLDIKGVLKEHPKLIPFSYDLAMTAEKAGKKDVADAVRQQTVSVIPVSPPNPLSSDERFLIPELTGPYKVIGVQQCYMEDSSRMYLDRVRGIAIDIHYPALQSKEAEYKMHPATSDGPFYGVPLKVEGGWTRSQPELEPIMSEKFPVVLFSPGLGASHDAYQHMVEELTSYGFCVVTIHSSPCYHTPILGSKREEFPEKTTDAELLEQMDEVTMDKAKDLEFVIAQIKQNEIKGLANADTDTIGVLGHSVGGSTAAEICRRDETGTIKAGVNMDGRLNRENGAAPVSQPFLHITGTEGLESSEDWDKDTTQRWEKFHTLSPNAYWLRLQNAKHMDYSSSDLYDFPFPASTTQDAVRKISGKYIVEFFQEHLKKAPPSELFNEKTMTKVIEAYDSSLQSSEMSKHGTGKEGKV